MLKTPSLFIYFAVVVMICGVAAIDYCQRDLCPTDKIHIGCHNLGHYSPLCVKANVVSMTIPLREIILQKHNELRNAVAGGLIVGLKPAVRMATMQWSTELANLAELNVKQCRLKLDECRNTEEFPYVGQSLSMSAWKGKQYSILDAQVDTWHQQSDLATMKSIESYQGVSDANGESEIGQFLQMIQDRAAYIGCAILRDTKPDDYNYQYLACNYSQGNINNATVYKSGPQPATECKNGVSKYPFLCSEVEVYKL